MKDFCVVGSGIAGSTIASLLNKKYSVEIYDKARGPGGRASNRRYKLNLSFDHGLQYFSPKSKNFEKFLLELKKKKVVKVWPGKHLNFNFNTNESSIKYIGFKGNNDICKYLIKNIKSNFLSTITNIKFSSGYWTITLNGKNEVYFKNLILTCPLTQSKLLASNYLNKKISNLNTKMHPNITVMAVYKKSKKIPISTIKFNDSVIAWASNENSKDRFKSSENLWTIQCTEKFSKKNINLIKKNKKKYQAIILKKFENLTGYKVKSISFRNIHGWKYAYSKTNTNLESIWMLKKHIGLCADWFNGSKAEDSWVSANALHREIKKNPPTINNRRV